MPHFQVFAIYDAPEVHRAFGLREITGRDEAEHVARKMMETFEADHFRRIIEVGERIGSIVSALGPLSMPTPIKPKTPRTQMTRQPPRLELRGCPAYAWD